jgi:hypothetical protein
MIKSVFLSSVVLLSGCSVIAEYPLTSAGVGVFAATGKGPTDHAISYAAKKDCATLRIIDNEPVCQDIVVPEVVDHSAGNTTPPAQITVASAPKTAVQRAEDVFAERKQKYAN